MHLKQWISSKHSSMIVLLLLANVLTSSEDNSGIQSVIVDKNISYTLECNVRFYEGVAHLLRWYKGSLIIFEQFSNFQPFVHPLYKGRAQLKDGSHLIIDTIYSGDDGNYTCEVHFIDGASYVFQQSTIIIVRDSPQWTYTPPAQMTGVKGSTLTIQCSAKGTPTPVLTWFKDGIQLRNSDETSVNNTHLQISDLSQDDVGLYKCVATNGFGHIVYTTAVILEGGTLITEFPQNLTVSEGQGARFDCSATAHPNNITYRWYKDDVDIKNIPTFRQRVTIESDGSLNFNTVRQDDVGTYKCVAWNGIGSWFAAEAHLTVTFTPRVDRSKLPDHLVFPIGHPGIIDCPTIAEPPVTSVVWRRFSFTPSGGIIDLNSGRFSLTKDFSLVILNVTEQDASTYTCTPFNDFGSGIPESIRVFVKDPAYFTIRPQSMYSVKVHDSVTMECQASPPASNARYDKIPIMTWRKINGTMPDKTINANGNLTIRDVKKDDGGKYECVATFDEVSVIASTQLLVQRTTPHAPNGLSTDFGHFDVTVSWVPGFDGGFPQHYFVLIRQTSRPNSPWQTIPDPDDHSGTQLVVTRYTIYGLSPDTEYEIKVLSANNVGEGMYSETVTGRTLAFPPGFHLSTFPTLSPIQQDQSSQMSSNDTVNDLNTTDERPYRYAPGKVGQLPKDASGNVIFPHIEKSIGPVPNRPQNFTLDHASTDGVMVTWDHPDTSPVPILYYKIEYKSRDSSWLSSEPILANYTTSRFFPQDVEDGAPVKYYFRLRAYGLLAYSDHTEAKILFLPKVELSTATLSQGAIIGIAIAALIFLAMIIIAIVVVMDALPCRRRNKSSKDNYDSRVHYAKATKFTNGSSQWPSYYPYYGGRFALDGEADEIFVTENSRQNSLNSRMNTNGNPGWHFRRDIHLEPDLMNNFNQDYYNPASSTRASNYASYNGLMHGYYDARTGIQMSPSIRHFPHSGFEVDAIESGDFDNNFDHVDNSQYYYTKDDSMLPLYEESPAKHLESHSSRIPASATDYNNGWFTPYAYNDATLHGSGNSFTNLSYDREQEIVLKPSLPRHSSMKPSVVQYGDNGNILPFEPNLSAVRETDTPFHEEVEYINSPPVNTRQYPMYSTNQWVQGQIPATQSSYRSQNDSYRRSRPISPMHVNVGPYYPTYTKPELEHRASVTSSIAEMRSHYNRDNLLDTIEQLRNTPSRPKRPGSFASAHSINSPFSPQIPQKSNSYMYSPHQELEVERYPELTSPVYYNRNNNRNSLAQTIRRSSDSPRQSYRLLRDVSRQTSGYYSNSGIGYNSWSKMDNSTQTRSPGIISPPTVPYRHDFLPPQSQYRYFGLYARPKSPLYEQEENQPSWKRYNQQKYQPAVMTDKSLANRAPSDSVDENYEFDPILIDSEPHDFFHIHDDLPMTGSQDSNEISFPPLYAEYRPASPQIPEHQRFEMLRREYLSFRDQQNQAMKHNRLQRLVSDIL